MPMDRPLVSGRRFGGLMPFPAEKGAAVRKPMSGLVLLACLVVLAGCGHRSNVMKPVAIAEPKGAGKVDMLVATTRAPSKDMGLRYGGERGDDVRLDNVVVSIPPDKARKVGEVQWPQSATKPDPAKSFVVTAAQAMTPPQALSWFKRTSGPKRRVLIFVHGFNNTYADAVFRFAQISHDTKVDAAPVLFTWPSRASTLDYVYDRESTIYSRFGLVSLLEAASDSPDVGEITILAHSMGTWLTMEALRDIALQRKNVSPKIKDVVLASPDIDVDVFRRQVLEMGTKRPRFTLFTSRNDVALQVSTFIAGDVQRLGGADLTPYKPLLASYGISVIDASGASQADPLGHSAFAESTEMLSALSSRLSNQRLDINDPNIGRSLLRGSAAVLKTGLSLPAAAIGAAR